MGIAGRYKSIAKGDKATIEASKGNNNLRDTGVKLDKS